QYQSAFTSSTGIVRTARRRPAEGILCGSQGVGIQQPYFSSLSRSVLINNGVKDVRIVQPRIYSGTYGRQQAVAISIGQYVVGFEVIGTIQQGCVDLVRSASAAGTVRIDGAAVPLPTR